VFLIVGLLLLYSPVRPAPAGGFGFGTVVTTVRLVSLK
jgi:hypothetical protein